MVRTILYELSLALQFCEGVNALFDKKQYTSQYITHHNTSQYTSHSYYNVTSSTHSRYEDDTLELSILYKQNIWKLSFQECFHCIVETISKIAVAHVVNVFESLKFQFGTHLIISLCSNLKQNGVVATIYVVMLELR